MLALLLAILKEIARMKALLSAATTLIYESCADQT
ncbi:MAG: hypothetical protein ACI8Z1_000074 [Candidatus Azotimanducaceae bacterium]|jgi:hypothetical protein